MYKMLILHLTLTWIQQQSSMLINKIISSWLREINLFIITSNLNNYCFITMITKKMIKFIEKQESFIIRHFALAETLKL